MRLFRREWDGQALVDALALEEADEARWSEHLLAAARAACEPRCIGLQWRGGAAPLRAHGCAAALERARPVGPDEQEARYVDALHAPGPPLARAASLLEGAGAPLQFLSERLGWTDGLVARAMAGDLSVILFWATAEGKLELSHRDAAQLMKFARLLEGALQVRFAPQTLGVLDPSGGWLDEGPGPRPSMVALWEALRTGEVSVVPQDRNGARRFVLVPNGPSQRRARALLGKEAATCERLAAGQQSKAVAGALQVSPSRLSRLLTSATNKLGFHTPFEALGVLGGLLALREKGSAVALSATELEVLRLVQRGLSNRDIAALRGRSERTIANQVAALLRKTGSGGRRALVARVGLPGPLARADGQSSGSKT